MRIAQVVVLAVASVAFSQKAEPRELIGTGGGAAGAATRHARYVRQRLVDRRAIGTSERIAELSGAPVDGPEIVLDGSVVWVTTDAVIHWTAGPYSGLGCERAT